MEWLNYHHLLYFWIVAKEGSIVRACEKLNLAQPTISGQLRQLEETLGEKLFNKAGRGLVMTEVGQVVFRYAEDIFGLGRELQDVLKGRPQGRPLRLVVGVSDLVPKMIAYRILQPAMEMAKPVHLVCHEDSPERLIAELIEHRLDVVLSDAPAISAARVKIFSHLLGSSSVSVFCAPDLAKKLGKKFPDCLHHAPFLLPLEGSGVRRSLDQWFDTAGIRPFIVGEFKDSALMKTFGQAGVGAFAGPSAIEAELKAHYGVVVLGKLDSVVERFYAISAGRKIRHPAVAMISEVARDKVFSQEPVQTLRKKR